jgi:hypothetical protein
MRRRSLIQLVSIAALYPRALRAGHCASEEAPAPYTLRFFSQTEHRLLQQLMELIIPADDHSAGAREAHTADFADWMLSHSSKEVQRKWRSGLAHVRRIAERSSPADALAQIAANEARPRSDADRFFIRLKSMTIDGYYTSEIGIHEDLGYKGNQYLLKFEGCTHAGHHEV